MFRHVAVSPWAARFPLHARAAAVAAPEKWAAGPATACGRLATGDAGMAERQETHAAFVASEVHQALARACVRPIPGRSTAVQHEL